MCCRRFSIIPGLYPLDAASILLSPLALISCRFCAPVIAPCSCGVGAGLIENHWFGPQWPGSPVKLLPSHTLSPVLYPESKEGLLMPCPLGLMS